MIFHDHTILKNSLKLELFEESREYTISNQYEPGWALEVQNSQWTHERPKSGDGEVATAPSLPSTGSRRLGDLVLHLLLERTDPEYGAYRDIESITYYRTSSERIAIPPKANKWNSNFRESGDSTEDKS